MIDKKLEQIENTIETEGNHHEFEHCGLDCRIQRSPLDAWCGYVAYPDSYKIDVREIDVHGGVTYDTSNPNSPFLPKKEGTHELGFDCAHYGDFVPGHGEISSGVYRDMNFAIEETKSMANQIRRQND